MAGEWVEWATTPAGEFAYQPCPVAGEDGQQSRYCSATGDGSWSPGEPCPELAQETVWLASPVVV